jgi:hypothetical protein
MSHIRSFILFKSAIQLCVLRNNSNLQMFFPLSRKLSFATNLRLADLLT